MGNELPSNIKEEHDQTRVGTLAIDLGNSTTVVAFQGERESYPLLLDLPPITRIQGEVPSLVYISESKENKKILIGNEILNLNFSGENIKRITSDFKRWIGSESSPEEREFIISPEKAGEILLQGIWREIPNIFHIRRLVLTAPVETYRAYRAWLHKACSDLPIEEVALVDEPTAAAMGAGLPAGSKLLVVDIGGSTTDFSLVALEGGEGRAEPIAQLMRFDGQDLQGKSNQILRCAKVLGKAGIRLGGRDLDRWIANYLLPEEPLTEELLNAAERLKCRLSANGLNPIEVLVEEIEENKSKHFSLSKSQFEDLLISKNFLKSLEVLLEKTLAGGRANGCYLADLKGVVIVGGGARIPLIREWLQKATDPAKLLTPPPIEAVAIGALKLTPGVKIKDILQKGVSLKCWDQRSGKNIWHPLFISGQPWPTTNPLEIILAASKENQTEIELSIGEPENEGSNEVVYINGIPTIKKSNSFIKINAWENPTTKIHLNPPGKAGQDCLKLSFKIDDNSQLKMEGIDLRNGNEIEVTNLGSIR